MGSSTACGLRNGQHLPRPPRCEHESRCSDEHWTHFPDAPFALVPCCTCLALHVDSDSKAGPLEGYSGGAEAGFPAQPSFSSVYVSSSAPWVKSQAAESHVGWGDEESAVSTRAEMSLQGSPQAASLARHFLTEMLLAWGVTDGDPAWGILADVSLVASELVTNAARFCSTDMTFCIEAHRDHIHVAVTDDHPAPAVARTVGPTAVSGRGLPIVAALSSSWGQTGYHGHTKTVWANLAFTGESVLSQVCAA